MKNKLLLILSVLFAAVLVLGACGSTDDESGDDQTDQDTEQNDDATGDEGSDDEGSSDEGASTDFRIAMVTDEGGVDDRSFNQSAWEGMQAWGEEVGAEEGQYAYYQSNDSADFIPNFNQALAEGYDIIYGIGFLLHEAVEDVAKLNPDQYFGLVDSVSDVENVVSLTFRDNEAAFLAGVAAAHTTESGKIGFVGGIRGAVIDRFQTGFEAGVAHVDDSIEVDVQYADSFSDAAIGQQIASAMFTNGADVVYHAAGAVGNGVFTEARNRLESDPDNQIWVIGVDRDQEAEGEWEGGNFTLTSTLKGVGDAIINATNLTMEEGFPGGENIAYGLAENGVDVVRGNMSDEAWEAVEAARAEIIDGTIEVPEFSYTEQ